MKCHYEILEVPREAELSEIKSAYRKSALKWHPDKNLNNTENAKEQFQLVQQAYEVLSDPQERAWYDKHREQILRGANSEFQDNSLDLFQYFTSTCFKGYGDDDKGFYAVYRNVFDAIIKEDMEFMEDKEEFDEIPRFGDSKSDYDEVVGPFYSYWSSYSTKKSYVWLDPYDIKEVRDRRLFKLVEKDNKKVRQKAKKERNEEVRNLVAFVRKRDKRVQQHAKMLEAKVKENRQKHKELSQKKRLERRQELNQSGAQAEWAKFDNVESELEEIEKSLAQEFGEELSNSEEDEEEKTMDDNLYCVACNKIFKTPKAFENHELSKKHKDNVDRLKQTLTDEEDDEEWSDLENEEVSDLEDVEKCTNGFSEMDEEDIEIEETPEETKKSKKKNKKAKNSVLKLEDHEETEIKLGTEAELVTHSDDDFSSNTKKKQKKSRNKKPKSTLTENNEEVQSPKSEDIKVDSRKKNKKLEKVNVDDLDVSHCCVTCKSTFQSKNKLFDHLKKTGHGVQLPNKNSKIKRNVKEK